MGSFSYLPFLRGNMKIENKKINILLIIIFSIIILETLHIFAIVKDIDLMNNFIEASNYKLNSDDYILSNMITYSISISIFIIFAIYNVVFKKVLRINKLYKGIWTLLFIGSILYKINDTYRLYSILNIPIYSIVTILVILSIIIQIILIIYIINMKK